MRAADEVEVVLGQELGDLVGAEGEGDAAVVVAPAGAVAVGVGPEEVAEEALVGDVDGALDVPDPGEAVEVRREAPVHAEDLVVDDGGDGEAVEAVGEELPEADAEAALALVVEAVDAVDGGALVVAPEEEEVVRVPDLVRQQQADGLDALLAAVHVVAQEQVVGRRRQAAVLEQPQEVRELPVDVTCIISNRGEARSTR